MKNPTDKNTEDTGKNKILIIKTEASGDVLRTTFVLEYLSNQYDIYWFTSFKNKDLIDSNLAKVVVDFKEISDLYFERVYSLEEDFEILSNLSNNINYKEIVGCFLRETDIDYSAPDETWFDMSVISKYGLEKANLLKMENKLCFQEMVSKIFGFNFSGQKYNNLNFNAYDSIVSGDIAIGKMAGEKWPNKNWAYYDELKEKLESMGFVVNFLPNRETIKQHISDIRSHKLIISGDSLPMHIATALGINSVSIFTCTSPAEIYGYGFINKIISKVLL
jgi:hypothetical protein